MQASLFDKVEIRNKSANSIIHKSFVEILPMTSAEYKNKEEQLKINYSFANILFGEIILASTRKGICYIGFSDDQKASLLVLERRFPSADFSQKKDEIQQNTMLFFTSDWSKMNPLQLHVYGTDFQLTVWNALLEIPKGNLSTYGKLASAIQKPKASRAVGTAIGSNPIAFIIPCHRVIQTSGGLGGYMWGENLKRQIIAWEVEK